MQDNQPNNSRTTRIPVILFVGKAKAGKDTLSDHLGRAFGTTKRGFADRLKTIGALLGDFPVEWAYSREGKARPTPVSPHVTVGRMMQLLGTEVGRSIDADMWIKHLCRDIDLHYSGTHPSQVHPGTCVCDTRFFNEVLTTYQLLPRERYKVHAVLLTRSVPTEDGRDPNHPSELGVDEVFRVFRRSTSNFQVPGDLDLPPHTILDNKDQTLSETYVEIMKIYETLVSTP